ncbi:MAG: hypothetical protein H6726_21100 [Sandaracinaceae bacterium]|nr:hypothetical protein [Myxococcales bacterium]MCB9660155.1 hypothetical protein [Sandaracinaceae bacterium]
MTLEVFELEMLGGGWERRYRALRPEVEAMPWGTLDPSEHPPELVLAARKSWTGAAFQEHRTGAACAETLRCLIEARAPLDLIAVASRFPLDEMVHVELCARMAMELGGGTEILHDPDAMIMRANRDVSPLLRAAELVVFNFCVGEALSIPLIRGTWHASVHPLPRAILGRIVKDEAAHGVFGFTFLDWAEPLLSAEDKAHLARVARQGIEGIHTLWDDIARRPAGPDSSVHALGWMRTDAYLALAERSLETQVVQPLRARGVMVSGAR